ncbi:MAG: hypothetical protein GEV06_00045 [Luteitalea sp.]|nr:hypothetical protein [Luteitalea sp.]
MTPNQINSLRLHTRPLPAEWTPAEGREAARAVVLCYSDGRFSCQSFFTQPLLGQLNRVEGLTPDAEVYFREIALIGMDLFHVRLAGPEKQIQKMCREPGFYDLLRAIDTTLTPEVRSRWFLETTGGKERSDVVAALDLRTFYLANYVSLNGARTKIHNIIVVGDRLVGRTERQEVVIGQLTPDVIEKEHMLLEVQPMRSVNELGKIDLLARVPNSDDVFLVAVENRVYEFDLWGEMTRFHELDERVKEIHSIDFNRVRSVLATNAGLFEIDIQEMPNMVRATSLPRQIAHTELWKSFSLARYVEDPLVLGIHPAMAIMAKTKDEKVVIA